LPTPLPPAEIFRLWYIRLASLMLIGSTSTAAQEIKVFSDLSSNFYRDQHGHHLVPWELRIIAVRLQAIGFNDWRRSIGMYYDLAREARTEILKRDKLSPGSGDTLVESDPGVLEELKLWRRRLRDLGIRVCSALVEMGDLAAASRHLEGLRVSDSDSEIKATLCLLYIKIGNLTAARECLSTVGDESNRDHRILSALVLMAEAKWDEAVIAWKEIADSIELGDGGDMARNNLAVCLLYTGKLKEVGSKFSACSAFTW
jgi:trafficking protein particle complex subunit 12